MMQSVINIQSCNELFEVLLVAVFGFIAHKSRYQNILHSGKLRNEIVVLENHTHIVTAENAKFV